MAAFTDNAQAARGATAGQSEDAAAHGDQATIDADSPWNHRVEHTVVPPAIGRNRGRSALRWWFAAFVLIAGAVAAINFWVDPRGLFGSQRYPAISGNSSVMREKLWLIDNRPAPPDLLILGSSKAREYDPMTVTSLTGERAFNGSVSGGRAGHAYALTSYVNTRFPQAMPNVVWFVDVATFSESSIDPSLIGIRRLREYFDRWEQTRARLTAAASMLDLRMLSETKTALRRAHKVRQRHPNATPFWQTAKGSAGNFRPNGFRRRNTYKHTKVLSKNLKPQIEALAREVYSDDYRRLTTTSRKYVRKTARLVAHSGATITFVIPPLHPYGHRRLKNTTYPAREHDAATFLEHLAGDSSQVNFIDLSNVSAFDGLPDGFYDGVHLKPDNAQRVLATLASDHLI